MKRIHRRWHRLIWAVLLPSLVGFLLWTARGRGEPAAGAVLPTVLVGSSVEGNR